MKKFSFLFALLCASVMGFAIDWSGYEYLGDGAGGGAYSNKYKVAPAEGQTVVNIQKPGWASEAGIYTSDFGGAISSCSLGDKCAIDGGGIVLYLSAFTAKETEVTVVAAQGSKTFTVYYEDGTEGGGGDALTDPELNLNSTAETLEASTSETFQIVATQSGDGAISYESSNAGVASVTNTGLVTAVGRGTATITVRTEETATYAAGSKTLAVTVTGPINWEAVSWLQNSDKYKLVVDPEIGSQFGGIRKEDDNLWIGFPSAVFGAMSIEPNGGAGAYRTFALSNFTQQINQFTVVCQNVTYTFDVYNADGEPDDLTGWNIAKGKTSVSGHDVNNTDRTHIAANDGDKNSRWSSEGGIHSPNVGAQDWWYVDLGGFYQVDQIKILFETAAPTDYDLLISNNAVSWTVLGTYTEAPKTGNSAEQYNEYNFVDKVGRYVKIFARNGYADLANGISMYEFEVYGDRASISDVNPPDMGTASLSGDPLYNQVNIAVSAIDAEDGTVGQFHVVDASKGVDQVCTAAAGVIAVTGLTEQTTYSFTITALDAVGNESGNNVVLAATTPADPTMPTMAAPVPSGTGKEILPIYCDAFTSILDYQTFSKNGFDNPAMLYQEKNISGDHTLVYDLSSGPKFVIWGDWRGNDNEIRAKSEYRGSGNGVDATAMEYLHIDIWSLQSCDNTINIRINDQGRGTTRLTHGGGGWQSYDLPLSDFDAGVNLDNVRWFKFQDFNAVTGKLAIDNVYFWKTSTGLRSVSATPNNAEYGDASVVVKSTGLAPEGGVVADETEVTFSATPNDGYIFVNWSNGETRATFDVTVDAAMNLTANFRALGQVYCNAELTKDGHTAYVTVKRSDVNEYKLIVRSTEELGNFGGTNLYRPENIHVVDLRNQGVLSDDKHTLTATISSEGEPYFGSPLYVFMSGGEVTFESMLNVRPEYAVACDDESVEVESIALDATEATIEVGATKTLVLSYTPSYAIDKTTVWTTSKEAVATVAGGVIRGIAEGTATITATCNGKTATCDVTVVPATSKTIYGAEVFEGADGLVGINYSITRALDGKLNIAISWSDDIPGLADVSVVINGVWNTMTKEGRSATWNSTDVYEIGDNVPIFFHLPYTGNAKRIDIAYTAGSDNEDEKPNVIVTLNDEAMDNATRILTHAGEVVDVIFTRTFPQPDEWYTLCLPFDMDEAQLAEALGAGYTLATLTGSDDRGELIHLNFDYVRTLQAGKPYMFKTAEVVENPVFQGVTVNNVNPETMKSTSEYMNFQGTFSPVTLNSDNQFFVGPDNYLYSPAEGGTLMDAFRCYFTIPASAKTSVGAKRARIVFAPEVATDIENIQSTDSQATKVIENGVLYIIRDNHMYNAQGLLVK